MNVECRVLGLCRPVHIFAKGRRRHEDRYLCTTRSAVNLRIAKERYAAQSASYSVPDLRAVYAD